MYVCLKAAVLLYFMLAYCRLRCALAQVHMNTSSQKRTYIFTYIHIYSYMLVFIYICMCIQRLLSVNSNHSCLTISCACNLPQCPIPMSLLIDCMDERTDERTVVYCVVALTCKWRASIIQQHQCRHYWQLRQLPVDLTLVAAIFLPHSQQLDAQTHTHIYIFTYVENYTHTHTNAEKHTDTYIYMLKKHTHLYIFMQRNTHTLTHPKARCCNSCYLRRGNSACKSLQARGLFLLLFLLFNGCACCANACWCVFVNV